MQINLSELFTVEGKAKQYACQLEMDWYQAPDGLWGVTEKSPVVLTITNQGNKVFTVVGKASLMLEIPCSRCMDPVRVPFELEIDEKVDMNQTQETRVRSLDEQFFVKGYYLDVDQLVGNELALNLPMKVLCREDCKGICNRCGTNLNYGTCDCDTRSLDPRMSVIQDIFQQLKEV